MANAKGINLIGSDRSKRVLKLHKTYNILQGITRKLLCWSRQLRQYRRRSLLRSWARLVLLSFPRPIFLANCDLVKWWTMWTLQRWWNSCHVTSLKLTSFFFFSPNFRCPGRAWWFLLLPSENVHWKFKCAVH